VADARGALVPLDALVALTVGKRLDSRAITVRGELAAAAEAAANACGDAAQLAGINDTERAVIEKVHDEVYIGFHELDPLLPPDKDGVAPPTATPAGDLKPEEQIH
jgi:hypothetical protein